MCVHVCVCVRVCVCVVYYRGSVCVYVYVCVTGSLRHFCAHSHLLSSLLIPKMGGERSLIGIIMAKLI